MSQQVAADEAGTDLFGEKMDLLIPENAKGVKEDGSFDLLNDASPGLTEELCRFMVFYVPPPGVDYEEGRDIYGNSVTPADDPDAIRVDIPDLSFNVNLTLDIADQLGIAVPEGLQPETLLGAINISQGKLYFNDQPLQPGAVDALIDECSISGVNFE